MPKQARPEPMLANQSSQHAICPLCKRPATFSFRGGDRLYQTSDYQASLFRCSDCHSLFQCPMPTREVIASFYPSGYWQEGTRLGLFARLQQVYVAMMLGLDPMRWVSRLRLANTAHLLDIGCSRGDWLARMAAKGMRVAGLEADKRAAEYARQTYGLEVSHQDAESWRPSSAAWDALTLFHLLEHVRDPADLLTKCHQALRPGGKLLIRVPNEASFQSRLFGSRWKGLELPRHLFHFNPTSLRGLVSSVGFTISRMSTWSLRDGPPALTSSLFPAGEPTRQAVLGRSSGLRTFAYLLLNWALTPLEMAAALLGRGSMITLIARKPDIPSEELTSC